MNSKQLPNISSLDLNFQFKSHLKRNQSTPLLVFLLCPLVFVSM